jgi:ribonuclease VapC
MFIDASAMIAIIVRENDGTLLAARLQQADRSSTSGIAIYEAVLAIARIRNAPVSGAAEVVNDFLREIHADIIPITAEIGQAALMAFDRYGRGRHPAQLNMGDCFAYACARALGVPLLYKSDDFARTDIAVA